MRRAGDRLGKQRGMRIAVVGMGFAGLRAAMLLERQGLEPLLFEARDRVGGRAYTISDEEGFVEAGAEWIDGSHRRVLALLEELGLQPDPAPPVAGWVRYGGECCREDAWWPDAREAFERVGEEADLLAADLEPEPWANVIYSDLDEATLGSFLDRFCATRRARWAVEAFYRSDEGEDSDRIGLLPWLCARLRAAERPEGGMSEFRFPGGAGSVAEQMAARLRNEIRTRCPLRRVERTGSRVILLFDDERVEADRAILALPPPALRHVEFDPPLVGGQPEAWEACPSSRTVKIVLRFRRAFWEDEGWPGRLLTDAPIQQAWEATRGGAPTVNVYVNGNDADFLRRGPDPVKRALSDLERVFPAARAEFVAGWLFDWPSDPWAGGGFSALPPGYALGAMRDVFASEGGLHFAGEHTALENGFVEGALESAERAVAEVAR